MNFFGPSSDFIMSGSDCGNIFIWDKNSEAIVQWLTGDESGVVNCLEGHPNFPIIASSGLDHDVKIWSPTNPDGVNIDFPNILLIFRKSFYNLIFDFIRFPISASITNRLEKVYKRKPQLSTGKFCFNLCTQHRSFGKWKISSSRSFKQ